MFIYAGYSQTDSLGIKVSGRDGDTSCVMDTVTYTCTLPVNLHLWRFQLTDGSTPQQVLFSQRSTPNTPISGVTIKVTESGVGTITTSLELTSSAELNGTIFTCGGGAVGDNGNQTATVMVFGRFIIMLGLAHGEHSC